MDINMNKERLLVIDDESDVANFIGEVGRQIDFEVNVTTNADQFKALLRSFKPTVIVLDLMMPDMDGIEMIRFLADEKCSSGLLLISGMDSKVRSSAVRLGEKLHLNMLGTLQKPIMLDDLESALKSGLTKTLAVSHDTLQTAIKQHDLCVYYQPKVMLYDGSYTVKGVEALVRWNHPDKGLMYPDEFIPVAEECGLIAPLTRFVLEEGLQQLNRWHDNDDLDLDISVNLAPQLLADTTLPDRVIAILEQMNIRGSRLTLEILETGLTEDIPNYIANLTRFRVKEINISIDDFGIGYSSMLQIYRMPFNEIKIDKSFVIEMDESEEAKTIVKAIVELSHNLGLMVCAEGVESESALHYLHELGCDLGQGYYISRPIPGDKIPEWFDDWQKKTNEHKVSQ
jgi:EAL domain-containing protein (putative c-di-GMP-specific phosphodiesterase class I)